MTAKRARVTTDRGTFHVMTLVTDGVLAGSTRVETPGMRAVYVDEVDPHMVALGAALLWRLRVEHVAIESDPPPAASGRSRGVMAYSGDGWAIVLWAVGQLRAEMEMLGSYLCDDLGFGSVPTGIHVWEGEYIWTSNGCEDPNHGDAEPVGRFRPPTDDEWQAIREGRCPWNDEGPQVEGVHRG